MAGLRADQEVERLHEVVGLLTETPRFYERLSAQLNLEFFARFYQRLDVQEQVARCLKLMGLWDRRGDRVGAFSKGMKQRLALGLIAVELVLLRVAARLFQQEAMAVQRR